MKVIITKNFTHKNNPITKGETLTVSRSIATQWIQEGKARAAEEPIQMKVFIDDQHVATALPSNATVVKKTNKKPDK